MEAAQYRKSAQIVNPAENAATTPGTSRTERLRAYHLQLDAAFSIDRLRIETRVMKETGREPMVMRRAKIFAAAAQEMPIEILPDELIIGHAGPRPLSRDVVPDDCPLILAGRRFATVVDTVDYGLKDFTPAEQKELIEDIFPYWRGSGNWEKTHTSHNIQALPDYLRELIFVDETVFPPKRSMIYTPAFDAGHYGHNSVDYAHVLKTGLVAIKEKAEIKLAALGSDDQNARPFLEAVILCLDAAAQAGARFAAKARQAAQTENDAARKEELKAIAAICERVPAGPARTFHEALQSIYLTQVYLNWESPRIVSQTAGRIDLYLYPYFVRDLTEGEITRERAQELLDCYLIKMSHVNRGNHISVGGYRADGGDATNEISHMIIEAMKKVRFVEPYISVLIHPRTPDALLIRAAELSALGTGHPVYLNADVLTTQMLARTTLGGPPVTLPQARLATPIGCYEPVISGLDSGYMFGGYFNMAAVLELVLTNGYSRRYQKKIGPETGDPRNFPTFDDFRDAYLKQLRFMMENFSAATRTFEKVFAELLPTPFESSLIHDCIERGRSREEGGARYNFNMIVGAGPIDAGDSLAAIRKLVFEEKKISMDELCQSLAADFEGREDLRQMLCNAPKFGNDDDYADGQAAWVSHVFAEEVKKQPNTRGGYAVPLGAPMQYYLLGGRVVGALPSGRKAWEPLSDAWSPCAGCDKNGPTAILGSMSKIDHAELSAGVTLNLRFDPAVFQMRDGISRFVRFIRAFADHGLYEVQFNTITTDTLRDAQKQPEKYKDLVVKVAGYSAYYTRLMRPLQDGIIARTEHHL
jgi:pyruvate formate-lyase/glycerol dehydratase family glycyl radical enzyme